MDLKAHSTLILTKEEKNLTAWQVESTLMYFSQLLMRAISIDVFIKASLPCSLYQILFPVFRATKVFQLQRMFHLYSTLY